MGSTLLKGERAAAHGKGVIDPRGKAIPVADPRPKSGLPELEYAPRTGTIVVQVKGGAGPMSMGIGGTRWRGEEISGFFRERRTAR